ncbi:MAG: permease-like cell division protein FtsX [Clostridia bacterium]|nr:permease-like cell division protein FtsX [Clostridia bacterium]
MKSYRPAYFIGEALKGLWRNKRYSIPTILVLLGCLVLVGSSYLIYENVDYNMNSLGLAKEIVVFIDSEATDEEVSAIGERIAALDNVDVANLVYISKEEALAEEADKYAEYGDLLEVLEGDNPLRDSYVIPYLTNEGVSTLVYQLNQIEGIVKINNRLDLAGNIENLKSGILFVLIVYMVILVFVCVFFIVNTIGLAVMARADEIVIMRYIGATGWFIALPFIIEGIIIGVVSSILAYFAQSFIYNYIVVAIGGNFSIINTCPYELVQNEILLGFLAAGLFCGVVGSFLSMKKYLKA